MKATMESAMHATPPRMVEASRAGDAARAHPDAGATGEVLTCATSCGHRAGGRLMPDGRGAVLQRVRDRGRTLTRWVHEGRRSIIEEECAQGTTEYAILVGVLVVIAIIAIVAFRDRVSELWDAIASGINSL